MAHYWPEPPLTPHAADCTAIVLVNLGTPAAPTAKALRPYLKTFLSDPRVVEIPSLIWQPILQGLILNTRPAKSAAKYASIWLEKGSPLKIYTEQQAHLLAEKFRATGASQLEIAWAMRYSEPDIQHTLTRLRAKGCNRLLIVPLYPQYAASTTASVMDEVARCFLHWRNLPEVRFIRSFYDNPHYIQSLANTVRTHWSHHGKAERIVLSFHGIPYRSLELGDPYYHECQTTARLLGEALEIPPQHVITTFQSRFGKAKWLQPYTQPTLEALAQEIERIDIMCPGFVSDCLETLEEIAMECRTAFLNAGGKTFHYIPCLNDHPDWIDALYHLTQYHLGNWLE